MNRPAPCPGPQARRSFLQAGSLGLAGLSLADLFRLQAHGASTDIARHKSVIFVWLPGGPPHLETYDMKPDAPTEVRGEFKPIATNVPGIEVCEHLPRHAQLADQYTLVRSVAHNFADHGGGHKRFLTARDPLSPVGFVNDYPMVGSMVARTLEERNIGVPNYVAGMDDGRHQIDTFSFGSAYLGPSTHPFIVPGDPSSPDFKIRNLALAQGVAGRLDDRATLLRGFDQLRRDVDRSGVMAAIDEFDRRAIDLLTSPRARNAFDIAKEAPQLRERYGMHPWGQRALLARRLVEAGVSFVTMVLENPIPPGGSYPEGVIYNWDSHAVNGHIFNDAKVRLPIYDKAVTALVEDLGQRGLTDDVLLIVTGEFGRTPRITYDKGRPGRDHWPQAQSILMAGGGMRTGQVVGSTNSRGEVPKDRPLTPNDVWATALHHLGVDATTPFPDHQGRPMAILPYGEPIVELL